MSVLFGSRRAANGESFTDTARPDFRLVLAFVWGDEVDTDTDGDSRPVDSREWTELYAQNRGRKDEVFNVNPASDEPLVLKVQSKHEWLAAAVAHLLAEITGGGVLIRPWARSHQRSLYWHGLGRSTFQQRGNGFGTADTRAPLDDPDTN